MATPHTETHKRDDVAREPSAPSPFIPSDDDPAYRAFSKMGSGIEKILDRMRQDETLKTKAAQTAKEVATVTVASLLAGAIMRYGFKWFTGAPASVKPPVPGAK
jgi:hypothetical protein